MGYTHYWYRDKELKADLFNAVVTDMRKVASLLARIGVPLAGGDGSGQPKFTAERICFNGLEKCGHPHRPLGITWPADNASVFSEERPPGGPSFGEAAPLEKMLANIWGTSNVHIGADTPSHEDMVIKQSQALTEKPADVAGRWFAGATLTTRTCGGDCSHDSFHLPRILDGENEWEKPIESIRRYMVNSIGIKEPVYNNPEKVGKYFAFTKTAYKPYDLAVNAVLIIAKHHLWGAIRVSSDGQMNHWKDGMALVAQVLGYDDFKLEDD